MMQLTGQPGKKDPVRSSISIDVGAQQLENIEIPDGLIKY